MNSQKNKAILLVGGTVVASSYGTTVLAQTTPASGVTEVGDTVDSIAGIAGAAVTVVLVALGVRLAIKQINRVMTKG